MPATKRTPKKQKTVAMTGASGYLAERLIDKLCEDPSIDRVLGFDVRPPRIRHEKFVFDELDIRNPALEARLSEVDVVVHLAFIMDPIKDEAHMRDVNVNGSQNVLRCAGSAGVRKIVYASSGVAYGAHPDNDVPLTEESPLRANLDFSYAAHKLEVEYVVREFRDEFPDVKVVVLRPSIVFGPNVDSAWSHVLEMPVILGIKGCSPPFQFVHEADVAGALEFAVHTDLDGAYNLAPDDWTSTEEILQELGRRRVEIPEAAAFAVAGRMWDWGLAEAPAGMLHYVMYPWVMSPARLNAAGFTCSRSSLQALQETATIAREHVRLGRSRVRRGDLVKGATAGLGLVGAAVSLRAARRRRATTRP
ncbi:MAG TPA: NAD-dependent epimerase/dehydratase family protein [Actinomycetota bacterium]|nr:NAD-dependent epimerase/dehydratase family protein [Actinomycetota bacterium]